MTNAAVYGYKKSAEDKNQWLIDPEVAENVRRIFQMTIDGNGSYQIARTFVDEKIIRPAAYIALRDGHEIADPDDQYNWMGRTIQNILSHPEYMGHTVNFRTKKESCKSKKTTQNPESQWLIFENTQEPIVSPEVWETAQKCRVVKRRPNSTGTPNPLTGLVYCGDCGGRMYNHISKMKEGYDSGDCYACVQYSQYPRKCPMHYIKTSVLRTIVLEAIRNVSGFVKEHEDDFVKLVREESEKNFTESLKDSKKKLARDKKRCVELDKLIKQIYEDKVSGGLSAKRFEILSQEYEDEQEQLEIEIAEIESKLAAVETDTDNAEKFISIVRKYTDFTELSASMLNEYVEKVYVYEAEKINHRRKQKVEIHLNFIGKFNTPIEGEPAEEEPYDPDAARKTNQRNYYYRRQEEILAKKQAERDKAKAEKLAAMPVKTAEEIAAEEAVRKQHYREYQRDYQREWSRKKRAERLAAETAVAV
jgi:hypothetical protein